MNKQSEYTRKWKIKTGKIPTPGFQRCRMCGYEHPKGDLLTPLRHIGKKGHLVCRKCIP